MDTSGVFPKTCSEVFITELYPKAEQMYRVKKRIGHSKSASHHHQDQICILNGRKSVGDNKASSALHQVIHSLLDLHFCSCINRRCGLIQDQDLIVCQDRSCNGK